MKTILRRVGARTREALQDAIIQALPTITAKDALGWFRHCGYPVPEITPDGEVRGEETETVLPTSFMPRGRAILER